MNLKTTLSSIFLTLGLFLLGQVSLAIAGLPATGSISVTSCTIGVSQSFCGHSIIWSSKNSLNSVYVQKVGSGTLGSGASGIVSANATYGVNKYELYDGPASKLDSASVTIGCVSGSSWNGKSCELPVTPPLGPVDFTFDIPVNPPTDPTGTISIAPTCTIPASQSVCSPNPTLVWQTFNPGSTTSVVTQDGVGAYLFTINSASSPVTVAYGTQTYRLKNVDSSNNPIELGNTSIKADCVGGTTWNGKICDIGGSGSTPSGLITVPPTCPIPDGQSTCSVPVTWSTINSFNTKVTQTDIKQGTLTVSTNPSNGGVPVSRAIYGGSSTLFELSDSGQLLSSASAVGVCTLPSIWDGTICNKNIVKAPSGTLTPIKPSCVINPGQSSCTIAFSWNTQNPLPGVASYITRDSIDNVTHYKDGNSSIGKTLAYRSFKVSYNSETFRLWHNGLPLDSKTVTASCAAGTSWGGSSCVYPDAGATIDANPNPVGYRKPSKITWSSTDATACTGTNFKTTDDEEKDGDTTSGYVIVSPKVSTTYSVNCTGPGKSATASVLLVVKKINVIYNEN